MYNENPVLPQPTPTDKKIKVDSGTGTSAVDTAKNKMLALLEKEIRLLQRKSDALKKVNDELKRQQDFEMKQAELNKSMVQAKISGDYIGAAIIGQQKKFDALDYKRESDQIALDNRISALEAIVTQIGNKDKLNIIQQALVKKITGLSIDNMGKVIKKKNYALGGLISGPGTGTSDSILGYAGGGAIRVSNGEYVVNAAATARNLGVLEAINNNSVNTTSSAAGNQTTVYNNYDMTITGGNADEVTRKVIQYIETQQKKNGGSIKVNSGGKTYGA
jgi:hypothetical protein